MEKGFHISLSNIGKRYYGRWLFRGLDMSLNIKDKLALIGTNGAGKSTLLRILAGQLAPSEGKIQFMEGEKKVAISEVYQHLAWAAPSISLYADLTLKEHLRLHFQFKKSLVPDNQWVELLNLQHDADKKLRFYSSGMLQRVKIGLALFADTPILLLDEPTANMDSENADYLMQLIDTYSQNRILVVASNLPREYEQFPVQLKIEKGKWLKKE